MFRRHPVKFLVGMFLFVAIVWFWTRPIPKRPGIQLEMGLAAYEKGDYTSAERHFREELQLVPRQPVATERLALLLLKSGRNVEASQYVTTLFSQETMISLQTLILFAAEPDLVIDPEMLERWSQKSPDDWTPLLGLAKAAFNRKEPQESLRMIDRVLLATPNELEAHVTKGRIILATTPEMLSEWNRQLPSDADSHPGIWFIRGEWCQQAGNPQMAIRCLLGGLRLDPNDRSANLRLVQLLDTERGKPFRERAQYLEKLLTTDTLAQGRSTASELWDLVELFRLLGRFREAAVWGRFAMISNPALQMRMTQDLAFSESYRRLIAQAQTGKDLNPAMQIRFEEFPEWRPTDIVAPSAAASAVVSQIRFRDDATAMGLEFSYCNGDDPGTAGMRMQEYAGGGVGVLDADQDGWLDLYLAQGCPWPPGTSGDFVDELFRNVRGQKFANATLVAGFGDSGFSQGVAVADFDNDGFDDLYLGNIGANRLYHGNGDGTYSDVTELAGVAGSDWTSSCAPGDFNGDSLTDFYIVNYLHGDQVFEAICQNEGIPVTCAPSRFESTPDRLFINLGDGRFEDQSAISGINLPNGPGLGVIAANLTPDRQLDVFVANDQQANFCFINLPAAQPSREITQMVRFEEQAMNRGLAYDRDGKAQACMGVAAGDLNHDRVPDIFVTNFVNEPNTLYLSQPGGLFLDVTLATGLAKPSYEMLGFGTSFLDGDLDGRLDLIVLNGHIGDHRHFGQRFRMPPQLFCNSGSDSSPQFAEIPASDAGSYFQQELLGRGLAVLDWNRDGRPDFCASHLDTPAALLTNETANAGHFLALRLCGVRSSRDATGTRIRVDADGRSQSFQLIGGGSYESSSERIVLCGLGDSAKVDELVIEWPSGETQSFQHPPIDRTVIAIEGRSSLTAADP